MSAGDCFSLTGNMVLCYECVDCNWRPDCQLVTVLVSLVIWFFVMSVLIVTGGLIVSW